MVGEKKAAQAREHRDRDRDGDQRADAHRPESRGGGGKDHDADGHQRAERVKAGHEVQHDEGKEGEMRHGAEPADRAQELRVRAFEHERPEQGRQREDRNARDGTEQSQGGVIQREHGPEEHVHQVDVAASGGHDQHPHRQRDQVEGRQACVLAQRRDAGHEAREERHGHACDQPADGHRPEREARDEIADGRTRQDRMGHRVARQAHAAQHQEYPDRRGADRDRDATHQRAPHEAEIGEGLDEELPHHAAFRPHVCGGPAQASHIWRARNWFSAVSTCAVGPWATSSRASISVRGK